MIFEFSSSSIYVSIEKFQRKGKIVLFDFLDSNSFIAFDAIANFQYDWESRPTMVEIINYNQRPVVEGSVYEISEDTISQLLNRIEVVEDSFVIGFRLTLNEDDILFFGKSKSFNDWDKFFLGIETPGYTTLPNLNLGWSQKGYVNVRNIGQGSWNEIYNDTCKIVFDIGTIYTTTKNVINNLLGSKDAEYQNAKPLLILSHWDVDHYHFLLALSDSAIQAFCYFVCRNQVPNLTARKVIGRFIQLNPKALIFLCPVNPLQKANAPILNCLLLSFCGTYLIFNTARSRSRNKSGIGFAIRGQQTSVVFAADLHYSQVSNGMLPPLSYPCDHYLIVPHHGGNAGQTVYNSHSGNKLKSAIVSVGNNPYNPRHPHSRNISFLESKGFKIIRTDRYNGDYRFPF